MFDRKEPINKRGLLMLPPLLTAIILLISLGLLFSFPPSQNVAAADLAVNGVAGAEATVILHSDFEDNTPQGWVGRGDATVTVTDTEAIGTYSLLTTDRTANWHGPSRDVSSLLEAGATYQITASVRLAAGQPPASQVKITMQRGSSNYDEIVAYTPITDTQWITLTGSYSFSDDGVGLILYLESDVATASFYIDEVLIVETAPPPPPPVNVIALYDFEDNTEQGWYGRGDATVTVTDTEAIDMYSLLTTDRTANWHGPSRNVLSLLQPEATYQISASVRLVAGQTADNIVLTMQRTPEGGSTTWEQIASSTSVTDTQWITLTGPYSFTEVSSGLDLYLESNTPTVDFYIDEIIIVETVPPPPIDSWFYDFEDGTTQGWFGRGDATVSVTDTEAIDIYSLLTTGRTDGWNSPGLDLLSLTEPGVTYDIEAYIRLVDGTPTQRVNIAIAQTIDGNDDYPWIDSNSNGTDADWVHLSGQYTRPSGNATQLTLYAETAGSGGVYPDFYIDDIKITKQAAPPIQTDIPHLYEVVSETIKPGMIIGAALEPNQLDSIRHTNLLTYHFNSMTPENVMKPGEIQPEEGNFDWVGSDRLADFARDNDMYLHGHTLIWHQQAAEWMFEASPGVPLTPTVENKQLVLDRMETHIRTVMDRYRDVINVWDVANEVIDPAEPDCMRRSRWFELTGTEYITRAFQIAYDEVPTATLLINDYATTNAAKRTCIYNLVEEMLDDGIPVHGIGMQMHTNIEAPSAGAIEQTIEMFGSLGVEVHITELDMSLYINDFDDYGDNVPEEVMIRQGYRYRDIFDVFERQADLIESITFWGMADDHTWLSTFPIARTNLPLLFDEQLQAKYAYWGVVDPSQLPVLIQELNIPQGTPMINGSSELLWELLPWIQLESHDTLTASFQTRWDQDYLYLLVSVEDATRDVDDKVEMYVDENNGKTPSYEDDDRHYIYQYGTVTPTEGVLFDVTLLTGGYRLEIGLPFSMTAETGDEVGFDLRITDGSNPTYPLSWNDPTHSQDTDTSKFGTLTLVDAIRVTEAVKGVPVIDGLEDEIWAEANEISTDVAVLGTSGSTARVKTLWDGNRLYVYAVVSDTLLSSASANAWEQDSIEVFIDQNNGKTEEYEDDDGQYRVNFENLQTFGGNASADTITSTTRILTTTSEISPSEVITTGYVVELVITLDTVDPEHGTLIGFDFQVNNDEDGNGTRDSIFIWHDPSGNSYRDTSGLGVLVFQDEFKLYFPLIPVLYQDTP